MRINFRVNRWNNPYAPNPAMLRQIMGNEGYTVYQWSDPPDKIYGMHKHPEDQSHWIVSGTLELTLESGETYTLEAGDRDFLSANTYHSVRVIGEEQVLYLIGAKQSIHS